MLPISLPVPLRLRWLTRKQLDVGRVPVAAIGFLARNLGHDVQILQYLKHSLINSARVKVH
jgi:hypothetical protein